MVRTSHSSDAILDAARRIVVKRGARAATLEEIVRESGAPTGSIYYRFRSVDQLLARLWIRAAQRSHAVVQEVRSDDAVESVVAGARSLHELCLREPEDAILLANFRPDDFLSAELDEDVRQELLAVNAPIERALAEVTEAIFGRVEPASLDLVLLALVELPYTFARRQIRLDVGADPGWAARLEACVRAVLAEPAPSAPVRPSNSGATD